MRSKRSVAIAIFLGLLVTLCILNLVFPSWQKEYTEWMWLNQRGDDPFGIAVSFVTALRLNHKAAYEMSSPELWPRIDKWMESHEPQECISWPEDIFGGGGGPRKNSVVFTCFIEGGAIYMLWVKDVVVETDGHVVDWGDVSETLE
jgi:hypothetical protein